MNMIPSSPSFLEKVQTLTACPAPHDPINILLVEDDEDDYFLTRENLADIDNPVCSLEWAPTFEAGLQLLRQQRHDVYLFDYRLGSHTGLELLQRCREEGNAAPIILLTGSGGELVAAEALRLGVSDYMTKSLMSSKSLHRAITNSLEKSHLRQTITEHQQHLESTNQALTKQNHEIQRFYHTLAHELKTPLTAIREFTSLIHDGLAGPLTAEQEEYLGISLTCVDQITDRINDLLDITRIDTGKLSLQQELINLKVLMSNVVATMTPAAQHKHITLSVSTTLDPQELFLDKSRMAQVLTNLVSNAIKFTPSGGKIEVEASNSRELPMSINLSVRDTGCGMAPEHLDRIFDRLWQVEDGHTRSEGGLGLGLTITQEIVKLHGGQITVHSQLGKGTSFTITIPRENHAMPSHTLNQGASHETKNPPR